MNSKAVVVYGMRLVAFVVIGLIALLFINNMSIALASSSYDPDKPSNLGLNEGYVAYIYNRVYRFMNMTGDDIAEMIDNPYTPIYHEGYEGFINYHSTSTTKYFPLTVFLYNRPTFIDEKTTFTTIVQAAQPLIGKDLQTITGYEQPAKVGPLFIVDAFHIYAASIQYTPTSYQSPETYYWYNTNYHQYRSAMTTVSNYVGIPYPYTKDPMIYATNVSSIVVFYLPSTLGLNRNNYVVNIGKDPYRNESIITAGLVTSVVNYNTDPSNTIATYYVLNPLRFRYMYNSYRLTMPDIIVLISPAAGLTEEDYNYLKNHNVPVPTDGVWISLPELFVEAGAKTVIATRMLPDIYQIMLTDTQSTFSYIANDVLVKIFNYLSQNMKVEDVINKVNQDINGADNTIYTEYTNLKDYYGYLILQTEIIQQIETYIIDIYNAVKRINNIPNPESLSDLMSTWINDIDEAISELQDAMYGSYYGAIDVVSNVKLLFEDWSSIVEDAIAEACEQLVIIALGVFDMFQLGPFDTTIWQNLVDHFMASGTYGLIGAGNTDYSLGDTINPPPSPPGGGYNFQ